MRNFKLTLCYDGTRYKGWQKQGNTDNTIQAKLEALLSRILQQPVELAGSGRTDAGVHAKVQICSFRAVTDISCGEILSALRSNLPGDIGALSLEEAPHAFTPGSPAPEKPMFTVYGTAVSLMSLSGDIWSPFPRSLTSAP